MKHLVHRKSILITMFIFLSLILFACNEDDVLNELEGYNQGIETIINDQSYQVKVNNAFTDDEEDDVDSLSNGFLPINTATVVFSSNGVLITNEIEDTEIFMEDGNLIVDSTKKMTLIVSGTLDGSIIVRKSDGKFKLVLNGITITSDSGPAINLQTEKRNFIVINSNTTNYITDGEDHPLMSDGSKTKAAIFSEEQLIISGEGTLHIQARYKHAIASDDYLKITSGNIFIESTVSDGLRANDYIVIDGGAIDIHSEGDGIEVERGFVVINGGKLIIDAKGDGIKSSNQSEDLSITPFINIYHGNIMIHAEGKGIISDNDIIFENGAIQIVSEGDAVSAKGTIEVKDGMYFFYSLDKQTIDGDLGVYFFGGISILLSDGFEESLKSNDGTIVFDGGTVVSGGSLDVTIDLSTQGYLKLGNIQKHEILEVMGQDFLMHIGFIKSYSHLIITSPEMVSNAIYEVYTGGEISGDNFYGYYLNGSYLNGEFRQEIIAQ